MIEPVDLTFLNVAVGEMSREQLIEFVAWIFQDRVGQCEHLGLPPAPGALLIREPNLSVFRGES